MCENKQPKKVNVKCSNEQTAKDSGGARNCGSWITKREGLLMFVVVVVLFSVCAAMCSAAFIRTNNALTAEMHDMQVKIDALNSKIEMYQSMLNDKPINITVNIDDKNYIYNPDTGKLEEQDPESTLPEDFDKTPFLGVGFYEDEDGYQTSLGIKVDIVYEGSPAEIAGIKVGDIIMAVNNQPVATFEDLSTVLDMCDANDEVTLKITTVTDKGIEVLDVKAVLTYKGYFDILE